RAVAQAQRQPALRRQAGVGLDRQAREADVEHRAVERDDQAAVAVRQADALVATTIRLVAQEAPSTADERHFDAPVPAPAHGPELGVAVAPAPPDARDHGTQLVVAGARAQRALEVGADGGEQAGEQAAVRGEAGPRAVAAERSG